MINIHSNVFGGYLFLAQNSSFDFQSSDWTAFFKRRRHSKWWMENKQLLTLSPAVNFVSDENVQV